ncbi:hypothetical protein JKF63_00395 [Porcisia hertigi]|uniref:Uncharacterized protein n=1 Tax=Porcisia hertigi TaxID=2761500 RepID=A0A836HTI4_9TRYP|nr:hypothetical protein JKF63_00395 [Porcisia hertigi]
MPHRNACSAARSPPVLSASVAKSATYQHPFCRLPSPASAEELGFETPGYHENTVVTTSAAYAPSPPSLREKRLDSGSATKRYIYTDRASKGNSAPIGRRVCRNSSLSPETSRAPSISPVLFFDSAGAAGVELPPSLINVSLHRPPTVLSSEAVTMPRANNISFQPSSTVHPCHFPTPECSAVAAHHLPPNELRSGGGADGRASQTSNARSPSVVSPYLSVAHLSLSEFSIVSLDLATVGVPSAPLLLRGTVSGTRFRLTTELAWATPEPSRQNAASWGGKETPASTWTVVWPAFSVMDTIEVPCALQGVHAESPQPIFVLECYIGTDSGECVTCTALQPAEEEYVGRCQLPLEDMTISGRPDEVSRPNQIEVVLRDRFGSSVGRVRFRAALQALLQRTVRLRNVAVFQDALHVDGTRSSHYRNAAPFLYEGEVGLALKGLCSAVEGEGEDSVITVVPADSRTPAAVRWTALPSVSFYDTLDTVGASSLSPLPLLMGHLYYTAPMQGACTRSDGWGSPKRDMQRRRILLGTIAIPQPPPPPCHSSHGHWDSALLHRREEYFSGQSLPSQYEFQMPLRVSDEGSQLMGMSDYWVRGIVETWTTPQSAVQTGARVVDRGSSSVSHPSPTPRLAPTTTMTGQTANVVRAALHGRSPPRHQESSVSDAVLTDERRTDREEALGGRGHQRARQACYINASAAAAPANGASPPAEHLAVSPASIVSQSKPQEDVVFEWMHKRYEALIYRVEQRLANVQRRRHDLQDEMIAQAEHARREESVIAEEYSLLENQLMEAEAAYQEAVEQLVELRGHHAHEARQRHTLAGAARERLELLELQQQLEALRAQMTEQLVLELQQHAAEGCPCAGGGQRAIADQS